MYLMSFSFLCSRHVLEIQSFCFFTSAELYSSGNLLQIPGDAYVKRANLNIFPPYLRCQQTCQLNFNIKLEVVLQEKSVDHYNHWDLFSREHEADRLTDQYHHPWSHDTSSSQKQYYYVFCGSLRENNPFKQIIWSKQYSKYISDRKPKP